MRGAGWRGGRGHTTKSWSLRCSFSATLCIRLVSRSLITKRGSGSGLSARLRHHMPSFPTPSAIRALLDDPSLPTKSSSSGTWIISTHGQDLSAHRGICSKQTSPSYVELSELFISKCTYRATHEKKTKKLQYVLRLFRALVDKTRALPEYLLHCVQHCREL